MGVKVVERPQGSGAWWVFIYHQGHRKAKKVGSKSAATEVARKIEAKLVLGDFGFAKKNVAPTFKECALKWLAVPHGWRESTYRIHEFNLKKYIFPRLGFRSIDEIGRKDIKRFVDTLLLKGLAPRTARNIKSTISGVFCHAVDGELVEANPVRDIKLAIRKRTVDIDPLTEEEAEKLLERTKAYKGGVYHPILLCALRTGMRIGEIQALQWGMWTSMADS